MRVVRTLGLLTLFAGLTTWFATRAALQRRDYVRRTEFDDRSRWENEGGAPRPVDTNAPGEAF